MHLMDYLLDNITNGGNDINIEEENIRYQISSTWNQNNKDSENISNIKLGKCEDILKEKYNISQDIPLLIFKLDIDMIGYSAPSVEYEIYNPITKEKLNLKYCQDEQINVSIPVSINENELFKYNPNSEFYNDICSTYTTNYKTDISLKDRQKEFLNNRIKDLNEIKIDKDKLKANLNLKNLINLQVLKCYKKLFTKKGLFHNIGSYILLSIIFLYIIGLIYLILKDYSILKKDIEDLFYSSSNINNLGTENGINKFDLKNSKNKRRIIRKSMDFSVKSIFIGIFLLYILSSYIALVITGILFLSLLYFIFSFIILALLFIFL